MTNNNLTKVTRLSKVWTNQRPVRGSV